MYLSNTTQQNVKILLRSGYQDSGSVTNPINFLQQSINPPHNTYISLSLEKMFFKHPLFCPYTDIVNSSTIYWTDDLVQPDITKTYGPYTISESDLTGINLDTNHTEDDKKYFKNFTLLDIAISDESVQMTYILEAFRQLWNSKMLDNHATPQWKWEYSSVNWQNTWTNMTTNERYEAV